MKKIIKLMWYFREFKVEKGLEIKYILHNFFLEFNLIINNSYVSQSLTYQAQKKEENRKREKEWFPVKRRTTLCMSSYL